MRRRWLALAAVAAGLIFAGCDEGSGQAGAREEAEALCAAHGGIAYLNFDYDKIDEIRCRDDEAEVPEEAP